MKSKTKKKLIIILACTILVTCFFVAMLANKNQETVEPFVSPVFTIITEDGDGKDLSKEDGYVNARIDFDDGYGNVITDKEAKIKVRGNSTSYGVKEPYNISFSSSQDLLGFGPAKKWCLLAECFDVTLLRNKIFFDLAEKMDLAYTPQNEFVKVYIDDVYVGVYLLTEKESKGKDRVDIHPQNGDFMFEFEAARDEDEIYYVTEHDWRFVINEPEEPEDDQLEEIENVLEEFDSVIYSGDYDRVKELIDTESFAKFYVLNEFAKPVDFSYSSVKFYKKDNKIYAGPVWDFDLSSGNYSLEYYYFVFEGESEEERNEKRISYTDFWCAYNPIFTQLLSYDQFRSEVGDVYDKYKKEFKEIYKKDGTIDYYIKKYGELFASNYDTAENGGAGWVIDERQSENEYDRFPTYDENIDYLRMWLKNRNEWIGKNNNWIFRSIFTKFFDYFRYATIVEKE